MKIFIVFIGIMLINVSILSYKGDYAKYAYLHRALDNIAFECAEIVASGMDENDAQSHAYELLEYTIKSFKNIKVKNYKCEVYYEDEFAVASIKMDVENLFRFPFSPVTSIVAERKLPF
jgi:hypothetical protein